MPIPSAISRFVQRQHRIRDGPPFDAIWVIVPELLSPQRVQLGPKANLFVRAIERA